MSIGEDRWQCSCSVTTNIHGKRFSDDYYYYGDYYCDDYYDYYYSAVLCSTLQYFAVLCNTS